MIRQPKFDDENKKRNNFSSPFSSASGFQPRTMGRVAVGARLGGWAEGTTKGGPRRGGGEGGLVEGEGGEGGVWARKGGN